METFFARIRAIGDSGAWLLIVLGMLLFSLRVEFAPGGWVNLPVMFTVIQAAGLIFAIAGLQLIASMLFWPGVRVGALMHEVHLGNISAGMAICGLFIFNGLGIVATVLWVSASLGAGIGAR